MIVTRCALFRVPTATWILWRHSQIISKSLCERKDIVRERAVDSLRWRRGQSLSIKMKIEMAFDSRGTFGRLLVSRPRSWWEDGDTPLDTLPMACPSLLGCSSGRHDDSSKGASRHAAYMLWPSSVFSVPVSSCTQPTLVRPATYN